MKLKMIVGISLTALAVLSFTGCASGLKYKKYGDGIPTQVGYSDFQIKDNQWRVTYTGPRDSNPELAMKFMYKRAKELCLEKGYKDFEVNSNIQSEKNNGTTYLGYGNTISNNQPVSSATVTCK